MKRLILFAFLTLCFSQLQPATQQAANISPVECQYDSMYAVKRRREVSATAVEVSQTLKAPLKPSTIKPKDLSEASNNLIDQHIFSLLARNQIEPAQLTTDEEYCRRVYLDLTGRQPAPEELKSFVSSTNPDKRNALADRLIGSPAYIDKWSNWMGDWVRNHDVDGNFRRQDLNSTHRYIKDAITQNTPIDRVASGFITYTGTSGDGPGSFLTQPIYFADIPQDAFDEAAAETLRTFYGVSAVCISCHDGANHLEAINLFLAERKRVEYWGIAAFFSQITFKFNNSNKTATIGRDVAGQYDANTRAGEGMRPPRTGGIIEPSFALFGGGQIDRSRDPRTELARLLTSNPQFARAFVNRIFAEFFTLGLVEPVDGFDLARIDPKNPPPAPWSLQPTNPELLEALANYFITNGYDMRKLIRLIVTSKAYQLSSRYDESRWEERFAQFYARKLPRRLTAEEVLDAITIGTKVPGAYYAVGHSTLFTTTMSLPGVEAPEYARGVEQSDEPYLVQNFLETFGRGDRRNIQRSNHTNLSQALTLLNSPLLISRVKSERGLAAELSSALRRGAITPEQAIEQLYLMTLGRFPRPDEVEKLRDLVKGGQIDRLQAALFNRSDFLYNY